MHEEEGPTRRQVTSWLALGSVSLVVGCKALTDSDTPSLTGETAAPTDTGTTDTDLPSAGSWATGGTLAMLLKDSYPDPFTALSACELHCSTTEGPCTADTIEREDISEGFSGLPVRLLLRIVDESCSPIPGARVIVWHTQRTGVYSGVTPSGAFCYGNDPGAEAYLYFRGNQVTDSDGVVAFDTCFPGWYSSRAPHIHIQVEVDGTNHLTTQVVFADALCTSIYGSHEEYEAFGLPDTQIGNDTVLGGVEDPSPYILETAQMDDGVMLAWKTIHVRSDTSTSICATEGSGGPGGGGPPP